MNLPVFVHSLSPHLSSIRLPGFFFPAAPATAFPSSLAGPLAIRPRSDFLESMMEYRLLSSRTDRRASTGERHREYCSSPSSGGSAALLPPAFSSDADEPRRTAARDAGGSLVRAEGTTRGGAKGRAGGASARSASESREAIVFSSNARRTRRRRKGERRRADSRGGGQQTTPEPARTPDSRESKYVFTFGRAFT